MKIELKEFLPEEFTQQVLKTLSTSDLSKLAKENKRSLSSVRGLLYRTTTVTYNHKDIIQAMINRLVGKMDDLENEIVKRKAEYLEMQTQLIPMLNFKTEKECQNQQ